MIVQKCSARIISPHGETTFLQCRLEPENWAAVDIGGYHTARISASGGDLWSLLDFLNYIIYIDSPAGVPVWKGRILEVKVNEAAMSAGLSIEDLANRIKVAYTVSDANGKSERRETAWLEDAASIQRYGKSELIQTMGTASDEQALAYAQQLLKDLATARPTLGIGGGGGLGGESTAEITAEGLYFELSQVYYSDPGGLVQNNVSNDIAVPIGFEASSNNIAFSPGESIYDFSGVTAGLAEGVEAVFRGGIISRRVILQSASKTYESYTSPLISFVESLEMRDPTGGLDMITGSRYAQISGSVKNSGWWQVDSDGTPTLQHLKPYAGTPVATGKVRTESGLSITVVRPQTWRTDSNFGTGQLPGEPITITAGAPKVAQSLVIPTNEAWPLGEIDLKLQRLGDPTDGVKIQLCSDSLGAPGTVLVSSTLLGSQISDSMGWVTFEFATRYQLQPGVRYWITVERTGSVSHHAYQIGMDSTESYSGGRALHWDGSQWINPKVASDMLFVVRGAMETTTQIERIVKACGKRILGIELDGNQGSGIYSHQYRDGDSDGWSEILDLLAAGYSDGTKMLAEITETGYLRLYRMPPDWDPRFHYTKNGELLHARGGPLEQGSVPVGEFAYIPDVNIPLNTRLNPFYMRKTEYSQGAYRIESVRQDTWQVGGITAG